MIILMIFLSNILTCFLTVSRVIVYTRLSGELLKIIAAPTASALLTAFLMRAFVPEQTGIVALCGLIVLTAGVFTVFGIVFFRRGKLCLWKFHS